MTFKKLTFVKYFALAAALGLSGLSAHATPITAGTYQATGITIDGSGGDTLTGTVTFNASGFVTAANLTFNDAALGNPVYSVVGNTGTCCNPVDDYGFVQVSGNKGQLELLYSPTLNSSGDIVLCVNGSGCNQASNLQYYSPNFGPAKFLGGTLNPTDDDTSTGTVGSNVAPEPSSLILFGTGLLGVAGLTRRKFVNA